MNGRTFHACSRSTILSARQQACELQLGRLRGRFEAFRNGRCGETVLVPERLLDEPPELAAAPIQLARYRRFAFAGDTADLREGEVLAIVETEAETVARVERRDRAFERR